MGEERERGGERERERREEKRESTPFNTKISPR
jgi:hypothetical protein